MFNDLEYLPLFYSHCLDIGRSKTIGCRLTFYIFSVAFFLRRFFSALIFIVATWLLLFWGLISLITIFWICFEYYTVLSYSCLVQDLLLLLSKPFLLLIIFNIFPLFQSFIVLLQLYSLRFTRWGRFTLQTKFLLIQNSYNLFCSLFCSVSFRLF